MVLGNFTCTLRMFLDSFELLYRKQKKDRKTVLEMWSPVCGKIVMLVHKVTLKKVQKSKKKNKKKKKKIKF